MSESQSLRSPRRSVPIRGLAFFARTVVSQAKKKPRLRESGRADDVQREDQDSRSQEAIAAKL